LFLNKLMNPSASISTSHIFTEGSLHVLITTSVKQCATVSAIHLILCLGTVKYCAINYCV
jgi:hypothetical protein